MAIRWKVSDVRPMTARTEPEAGGFGFTVEKVNSVHSFSLVFSSEERAKQARDFVNRTVKDEGAIFVD